MGRYVTLKRNGDGGDTHIMNLCEVQVYGYFYRGKDFDNTACRELCVHDPCRGLISGSLRSSWYKIHAFLPDDISLTNPCWFIK